MISLITEAYNKCIKSGREPEYISCHTHAVGSIIKELYHEHIPIKMICIDDSHPNSISFGDNFKPHEQIKEWYSKFTVIIPPPAEKWKEIGYTAEEIRSGYES